MEFQKQITLFGERYLLLGDLETGGPICTPEQYENFECSYAYLRPDGNISRHGIMIGTRDDIVKTTLQVGVQPKASVGTIIEAFSNIFTWGRRGKG